MKNEDLVQLPRSACDLGDRSENELLRQKKHNFSRHIKFSILTPLYNPPLEFLKEMIESVCSQTYSDWELCLADGSGEKDAQAVSRLCNSFTQRDSRILYYKLPQNLGISGNTNECIKMSSGDYLIPVDQDDLLHPSALYELMKAIEAQKADFLYTDEVKFSQSIEECYAPKYKPDYAPDELLAHNYICHLACFKRELVEKVGRYDSDYDGSQDHDMVLKISECADRIVHIQKLLYFWRVHPGSVASGVGVKSYAVDAGIRVVEAAIRRRGENAAVHSRPGFPSLYEAVYELHDPNVPVDVLIYNVSDTKQLKDCIEHLDKHQFRRNIRLIILCSEEIFESVKTALWDAPTVWPFRIETFTQGNSYAAAEKIVKASSADLFVFVSADTLVETDNWCGILQQYAQQSHIAFVAPYIWKKNGSVYDVGLTAAAGKLRPILASYHRGNVGYEAMLRHVRNASFISGKLCMISRSKLLEVLDTKQEKHIDIPQLCPKLREKGFLHMVLPYVDANTAEDTSAEEFPLNMAPLALNDPYVNRNLENYI